MGLGLTVRVYDSAERARAAAAELDRRGFARSATCMLTPPSAGEGMESAPSNRAEATVESAIRDGRLPSSLRGTALRALSRGRSLVAVEAPLGSGQLAVEVLEGAGPVADESFRPVPPGNPAPFSEFLGLPVLLRGRSRTHLAGPRAFFSNTFGLPLLSKNPAPLSSMFGMSTRAARPKTSSFGLPLLSKNPAPLSSAIGMGTRSGRPKTSSFGLPLLSKNPAPLSNSLGLKVLSDEGRPGQD